ncbi:dethiobiotin synthase [Methylotenera versatilis]|uniref:dethiobiotin synthase n=1 Tax=Methylotenera versatilis TaxID=1055487 RepID=UPI0006491B25|nr:dethiobiotin synthase [Methylotenera versatilis]
MKQAFFITGTDTGVGKTYIACKLIQQYVAQDYKVIGMKPVAAGCELVDGEWVNDDVLQLEAVSNVKAPRVLTNPYSFNEPIAPHIAAELAGKSIEIAVIKQAFDALSELADIVIVEGAGGFLVPLNETDSMADLANQLNIPIILVVGMKLGCINHALLTAEAINARSVNLAGWVANPIEPKMQYYNNNVATIAKKLHLVKQFNL